MDMIVNDLVVDSFDDAEVRDRVEVDKSNFPFIYNAEWKCLESEKPVVFRYHVSGKDGLDVERTHIVSDGLYVGVDTYSDGEKTWSSMVVTESTLEGVMKAEFFVRPGFSEMSARFEMFSNESFAENGMDVADVHPITVARKDLFTPLTMLHTDMCYVPLEEMSRIVTQAPHMGLHNLYEEFREREELKNQDVELQQESEAKSL